MGDFSYRTYAFPVHDPQHNTLSSANENQLGYLQFRRAVNFIETEAQHLPWRISPILID